VLVWNKCHWSNNIQPSIVGRTLCAPRVEYLSSSIQAISYLHWVFTDNYGDESSAIDLFVVWLYSEFTMKYSSAPTTSSRTLAMLTSPTFWRTMRCHRSLFRLLALLVSKLFLEASTHLTTIYISLKIFFYKTWSWSSHQLHEIQWVIVALLVHITYVKLSIKLWQKSMLSGLARGKSNG
jgi:hypothetical protein